jgi:NAD(P)-dependent dehydrogenase (short-subunit alcohol dehydrogenase family)
VLDSEWKASSFDYLVNNAGFLQMALFEDTTEELFDTYMRVLFKGPYFLTQALLPVLAYGGAIVNVTSNYEVSATPCTESETEQAHREALQKPCCTKPRATSRAYGDLTATGAAVGWNCPAFARRIASNTTV